MRSSLKNSVRKASVAFTTQSGAGNAYVVSAASDLLVKLNVAADNSVSFTVDSDTTRFIDLNNPTNSATSGANAGKNPQGIAITSSGGLAYVANFVSRNVSVVDLATDTVITNLQTSLLPIPCSPRHCRRFRARRSTPGASRSRIPSRASDCRSKLPCLEISRIS